MDNEILEFLLRFYGMIYLFLLDKPNPLLILKNILRLIFLLDILGNRLLFLLSSIILISIITIIVIILSVMWFYIACRSLYSIYFIILYH